MGFIRDTMPRTYKPKSGMVPRRKHEKEDGMKAVAAVDNGLSYRKAENKFGIPRAVITRHKKNMKICW